MFNDRHLFSIVWKNQSYIFNNMEDANKFIKSLQKTLQFIAHCLHFTQQNKRIEMHQIIAM